MDVAKIKEINTATYDIAAKIWPTIRSTSWQYTKEFLDDIEQKQDKHLADIGCGAGRDLLAAKESGFDATKCIGIDASQGQLEQTQNLGFTTKIGTLTDIPLADKSQDIVLCIAAFHHLVTAEDQKRAAEELFRISKPESQLLLTYWSVSEEYKKNNAQKLEMVNDHVAKVLIDVEGEKFDRYYYLFDESQIIDLFTQAGFSMISASVEQSNVFFVFEK